MLFSRGEFYRHIRHQPTPRYREISYRSYGHLHFDAFSCRQKAAGEISTLIPHSKCDGDQFRKAMSRQNQIFSAISALDEDALSRSGKHRALRTVDMAAEGAILAGRPGEIWNGGNSRER